jgi:DNA repair ATPase RecN
MKGVKEAEKAISSSLNKLNLTHAQFQIEVTGTSELHLYGAENLRFAFSANKGQPFEDIKSVASGGEISRVMLAIKAATAHLNFRLRLRVQTQCKTWLSLHLLRNSNSYEKRHPKRQRQ